MTKWPRPKEIHSSALPAGVTLSVRPWPCQVPVKVASVALSPPQPASAKVVIAAAGSAAIRDHEAMSHSRPPRHTRSRDILVQASSRSGDIHERWPSLGRLPLGAVLRKAVGCRR